MYEKNSQQNSRKTIISNLKEKNIDIKNVNFQSSFVYLVPCYDKGCNTFVFSFVNVLIKLLLTCMFFC